MRTTFGPERFTVLQIQAGWRPIVYRIVRSDVRGDPVLLNSFRSNYELGGEPRRVERRSAVIHMGISAYLEPEDAKGTAQRFRKLGDFVAQLRLVEDQGFNFAHTGHPGHLTIWGDPVKLEAAMVDIKPVEN